MSDLYYAEDRAYGDSFMREVKRNLGEILLTENCGEEDTERATDLIVLTMANKRVAVRIRRYSYYKDYGDEFTIRYSKRSGATTEFAKIMSGFGDYFFYGFGNEDGTHLIRWSIGDLNVFRSYVTHNLGVQGKSFLETRRNWVPFNDDSFLAFKLDEVRDINENKYVLAEYKPE